MKSRNLLWIAVAVISVIVVIMFFLLMNNRKKDAMMMTAPPPVPMNAPPPIHNPEPPVAAIIEGLNKKGCRMYGNSSCPHCMNQLKEFGDAASAVNYVNCKENPQECDQMNIRGVPHWICADGSEAKGYMPLARLASSLKL